MVEVVFGAPPPSSSAPEIVDRTVPMMDGDDEGASLSYFLVSCWGC